MTIKSSGKILNMKMESFCIHPDKHLVLFL